jgi:hypothetical protein
VAPEGFAVALVRRDATGAPVAPLAPLLTASGAEVRPGPAQPPLSTYLVVPEPGSRSVVLRASDSGLSAESRYSIGPPAAGVTLELQPAAPVKGRDKEATLTVRMLRPDGALDDSGARPVVRASVGRVEELARVEPGTYRARYVLPATNYPEVAILVALSAWPHPQSIHGAYGTMLVPLAAEVEIAGETERNAEISISIAGKTYGPAQAGSDGSFRLPVVIPPGNRIGQSRVVDRAGNVERKPIPLGLPPTDGLSCVLNPPRLPADGVSRARMLCAASDAQGKLVPEARVTAKARHGSLRGPQRAAGGLLEWIYTPPQGLPATPEQILATWPQGGQNSREDLALQLVQGPVEKLSLTLAETVIHRGSTVEVGVEVADAFGRPRPGAQVAVSAPDGTFSALKEERPGVFHDTWTLPEAGGRGEVAVTAVAFGPLGTEPARMSVWVRDGELYVGVSDLAGLPIPNQPLSVSGEQRLTGADGTVRLGPPSAGRLEVVHGVWPGLRKTIHVFDAKGGVYPQDPSLVPAPVKQTVRLEPPVSVNVMLKVAGRRVTYWVKDGRGNVLKDRPVYVWLSSGRQESVESRDGYTTFTVGGADGARVSVSVADVKTGVTALDEVKP